MVMEQGMVLAILMTYMKNIQLFHPYLIKRYLMVIFFPIEPGFYVSNEFGLRIENLYFAKKYTNGIKLEG